MFGFETAFSAMWEYAMDYVRQLWLPVLLAGGVYLAVSVARSRKRGLQVPPARRGVMLVFV